MSRKNRNIDFRDMNFNDSEKIGMAIIGVLIIALIIYSVSSCGCSGKNTCNSTEESYQQEFNGGKKCTNSYRKYMNSAEDTFTLPRDRCKLCKGYNNYSYESYEAPYKVCPHNCRQYGVAQCDQGTMM